MSDAKLEIPLKLALVSRTIRLAFKAFTPNESLLKPCRQALKI